MRTVSSLRRNADGTYAVHLAGDDGVTAPFSVSEDLVVAHRLLPGRVLEGGEERALVRDLETDGLYAAALRLLERGRKTAAEIRTFLKNREADPARVDRVYAKLCDRGFVDDLAYANAFFDYRFGVRRDGPAKILFDLDRKGVDRTYALEAVAGATPEAVRRNLDRLFDAKLSALSGQPRAKAMRAMKGFLYRRGYDPGAASACVEGRRDDFPAGAEEDRKAKDDLAKIRKRLAARGIEGSALRQKTIQALMNKGYRYDTIRRVMEGSEDDES